MGAFALRLAVFLMFTWWSGWLKRRRLRRLLFVTLLLVAVWVALAALPVVSTRADLTGRELYTAILDGLQADVARALEAVLRWIRGGC